MNALEDRLRRTSKSNLDRGVALTLAMVIGVLYSPIANSYFSADDFNFLSFLFRDSQNILNWQHWNEWFIGGIVNYSLFRPMGHVFWLINYIAFGLDPLGYHLAGVLAHWIVALAVYFAGNLLTHNRLTAGLAALIFAIMPVHVEAVSWAAANYDVWCAIYFLIGLIFYILYRQHGRLRFYFFALGSFVFALASREIALVFPLALVLYDLIYHWRDWRRTPQIILGYVPFGIAVVARLAFFGQGYRGLTIAPEGLVFNVDMNMLRLFDPILTEPLGDLRWLLLIGLGIGLVVFRFESAMVFSLFWIPITLIPTLVGGVNDRSFYIASIGLAWLFALLLTPLLANRLKILQMTGVVTFALLVVIYGSMLVSRNQAFVHGSQVAHDILTRVQELHPTFPSDAHLVFVGVPGGVPEGAPVLGTGLGDALQIAYKNPTLAVSTLSSFPIWLDQRDRLYFFQVDHRRVTERADLIAALQSQYRCTAVTRPAIIWDSNAIAQNWKIGNQLTALETRDDGTVTQSLGSNSYMTSPVFDLDALVVDSVEIEMRVSTKSPTARGALYWRIFGLNDFTPDLSVPMSVQADGQWNTYRVDLVGTGTLMIGERIAQLRLNPVEFPAEIALKSIRVNVRCSEIQGNRCMCAR